MTTFDGDEQTLADETVSVEDGGEAVVAETVDEAVEEEETAGEDTAGDEDAVG